MIFGPCSGRLSGASAPAAMIGRPTAVPVNPHASVPEILKKLRRSISVFDLAISVREVMHALYRDGRFDRRMRIVIAQGEILEAKIVDAFDGRVQLHPRQRPEIARQLLARLLEMVPVKMQIAKGVNEFGRTQLAYLRHHHGEQRIRRNVERNPQKKVGAALIKLAAQLVVAHIKLKEDMAGG